MSHAIKTILFVCTGNVCRSPMAEYILRHRLGSDYSVSIRSAGLYAVEGAPASEHAVQVLDEWGIDARPHKARLLTDERMREADLILVKTEAHRTDILQRRPEMEEKVRLLGSFGTRRDSFDIPDPAGLSLDMYRRTRDRIDEAVSDLILYLMEHGGLTRVTDLRG